MNIYNACGMSHEGESFNCSTGEFDDFKGIEVVTACVKRAAGQNLLCAHVDVGSLGISTPIDMEIAERISLIESDTLREIHTAITWFKHQLDDIRRVTIYLKQNLPRELNIRHALGLDEQSLKDFNELKEILRSCNIPIPGEGDWQRNRYNYKDRKIPNRGQATRLNFIILKLQKSLQAKYEALIKELIELESQYKKEPSLV